MLSQDEMTEITTGLMELAPAGICTGLNAQGDIVFQFPELTRNVVLGTAQATHLLGILNRLLWQSHQPGSYRP